MKYILSFLSIAFVMAACQAPDTTPEAVLRSQLDSLKKVHSNAGIAIKDIEEQLIAMDTTRKLVEVTTMELKKTTFQHYFHVQGNLEADKSALIYPESQGLVKDIYIKEGQKVAKGAKILRLDAGLVQKQINEMQGNLALATDVFQRQKRLWDQNVGSEIQYLEAKNRKESLENTIATLRQQQGMSTVRAPFAGTVDDVMPKIGEMASPGMPVARIINVSDVYLSAKISERYLGKVDKGDSVLVDFPGVMTEMAVVKRTGAYIDPGSRSFEVVIDVTNKEGVLKPNMLAKLKINDYTAKESIVLPSSMIQQDTQGRNFVYTIERKGDIQRVKKVMVETGLDYDGQTEIRSGLNDVTSIVNKGARQVANGEEVDVKSSTMASK